MPRTDPVDRVLGYGNARERGVLEPRVDAPTAGTIRRLAEPASSGLTGPGEVTVALLIRWLVDERLRGDIVPSTSVVKPADQHAQRLARDRAIELAELNAHLLPPIIDQRVIKLRSHNA